MRCEAVAIEELVLRLPGVAPADAPALADEIVRAVQARLRGTGRIGRWPCTARLRRRLVARRLSGTSC